MVSRVPPRLAGGDGAVADRVGAAYEAAHLVGEFDVVPGDALDDVVFGDATVIQPDGGDTGGIVVDLRGHVDVVVGEDGNEVAPEFVVAHSGDGGASDAVLGDVVDEVGGCAARLSAVGEHIPQQFADGDHGWRGGIGHDGSWVETGFETGFGHSEPRPE